MIVMINYDTIKILKKLLLKPNVNQAKY